jgi:hypothetical protein
MRKQSWSLERVIKLVLSLLFFLCLSDMVYGYYQFVRFAGLVGIAILAYQAHEQGRQTELIIYAVLGIY